MRTCTWEIEHISDENVTLSLCGRTAVVEFDETREVMGRLLVHRYPRCRRHASDRVIALAKERGYGVTYLTEER